MMPIGGIPHPFQGDRKGKFERIIWILDKLREALSSTNLLQRSEKTRPLKSDVICLQNN